MKQLAVTFPDTFPPTECGGRLSFLTAEYAYSVGDLDAATAWCAQASEVCCESLGESEQDRQQQQPAAKHALSNSCHILRGMIALSRGDSAAAKHALECVRMPPSASAASPSPSSGVAATAAASKPAAVSPSPVRAVAAAKLANALLEHQKVCFVLQIIMDQIVSLFPNSQGQYQPAKTLGMQAFTLSQKGNMQLTANALSLLGEVYLSLGTEQVSICNKRTWL